MNYTQLKANFKHTTVSIVTDSKRKIMGVLRNLDNLDKLIEEDWDLEVIKIGKCNIFDYGYKAVIEVEVNDNGENYKRQIELTASHLY